MREAELIQKINTLKQIKPREDWVVFVKQQILSSKEPEKPKISWSSWLLIPFQKPALALSSLIILALLLSGGLIFYFKWQPFSQQIIPEDQQVSSEKLLASLKELQNSLEQIVLSLNSLKNTKTSNHTLGMTAVIKATAQSGEQTLKQLGATTKDPKVLATLNELEERFTEVEQMSQDVQGEMIEALIKDLKQRTLTKEDEDRLQKVEEYYNEGKYIEATILLQRIGS